MSAASRVIDVRGGASTLVDDLLDRGLHELSVLDVRSRLWRLHSAGSVNARSSSSGMRQMCWRSRCRQEASTFGTTAPCYIF